MSLTHSFSRDDQNGKSVVPSGSGGVARPPWILEVCLKRPAVGVVAIPLIRRRTPVASELQHA